MDWELKEPAWELNELGPEDDPRLAALVGSSSLGMQKNDGGFSVDLKLGGLGDLREGLVDNLQEPRGSTIASSPSGSSKRSKATNGMQNVSCLVDGCTADLSNCREYHRRHRVCERHSKTPVVFVCGKEQRFCQQCSRFQSLGEFDEEKRSCRKRLDGHNRRRRKPQPEPFSMSSGSFFSNYQGARLLQFGGPQECTNSTVSVASTWPRIANQQSTIPNSFGSIYNGGYKRFPFLLANNPEVSNHQAVPDVSSACQRLVNNNGASPERHRDYQKILSDGLAQSVDCECVRSLLSPHPMQTSEATLNHLLRRDVIHDSNQQQPIGTYLHFDGLSQYSQGMEEKPLPLVSQATVANNLCSEMFQVSPDDLLEKGASQVLPFSWK